jgi:hypothetical protein
MAVHGTVRVDYAWLAEALGLVRSASRNIAADPELALHRLNELERLVEDRMALLEEQRK